MAPQISKKLKRQFYARPTLEVARDLIGKCLVFNSPSGRKAVRLVETEAYIGPTDPACHAAVGLTERNRHLWGPPGHTYIYLIYGMYFCLNFVTEKEGFPAAVLVRAAEPIEGFDGLIESVTERQRKLLLSGPGRLCRAMGLTTAQNGIDATGDLVWVEDRGATPTIIRCSPRVGIRNGLDKMWRMFDAESPSVSAPRENRQSVIYSPR